MIRRREFITLLGCAAAAWPVGARAQQGERVRRVGVLMFTTPDEPESQTRIAALQQGLQAAGWEVGRNLRIDVRWSGGDTARLRRDAVDLVALGPDVIVAGVGPTMLALPQATRTVPIVMAPSIRSAAALSKAWRDRAATSPALLNSNMVSAPNGLSCSGRSRHRSRASVSCGRWRARSVLHSGL